MARSSALPVLGNIAVVSLLVAHASASLVTTPDGTLQEAAIGLHLLDAGEAESPQDEGPADEGPEDEAPGDEGPEDEAEDEALAPAQILKLPDCDYAAEVHTVSPCEDEPSMSCVTRTCAADDFLYIVCTVPDDWEANGPKPPTGDCLMMANVEPETLTADTPEVETPGIYQEHVGVDYIPAKPLGPDNFFNVTSNEVEITDTCYGLVESKEECQMNCDMHAECNGAAWLSEPTNIGEGWPWANCFLKKMADACALPGDPFTGEEVAQVTLSLKCEPTAADAALKAPMCVEADAFEASVPASAPDAMGPVAMGPDGVLDGTREFPAPGEADAPGAAGQGAVGEEAADGAPGEAPEAATDDAPAGVCTAVAALVAAVVAAIAAL